MAEWNTDRKLRVRQGGQAEDEDVPLVKSPPATQPRLTLPSVPRVSAVPSQRPMSPRPRASGLTGQHAVPPASASTSTGLTGKYAVPSAPTGTPTGLTGKYAVPSAPKHPSGLTGQHAVPPMPTRPSGLTGQHA